MLFGILLQLGLNLGYPALGFVLVDFSRFLFPHNLIKKSFKKGFHSFPLCAPAWQKYEGKSRPLFAAGDPATLRLAHEGVYVSSRVQFGRHGKY